MKKERLMIIDGNSILNRAFYGLQGKQLLATSDGLYTNAIFGFLNIVSKYMEEEKPQYICVAFDLKAPTFRHKEFEGYKAKRKGMPPELAMQLPVMKEVLDAMNILRLEYEGYEADDIIGSVSKYCEGHGVEAVIVTGDRDSLQLAGEYTRIKLPITRAGKTETEEYDVHVMQSKYGVTPQEFIDVKALMGDASDNIPGVPGIGEKTAFDLIHTFHSIENLYNALDTVDKKSVREKLENNRELAFLSKRLATIYREVPMEWSLDAARVEEPDKEVLYNLFQRLEFKSLIEKMGLQVQTSPAANQEIPIQVDCLLQMEQVHVLVEKLKHTETIALYHLLDKKGVSGCRLAGIGMAWSEANAAYISIGDCLTEEEFLAVFRDIFENPSIRKVGHDLKNFIVYLKQHDITLQGIHFDSMIAAYLINPSRESYTVAELASEYLGKNITPVESLAGKGKSFKPFVEMDAGQLTGPSGIHANIILEVCGQLETILRDNDQLDLYYSIELPLVEVLAYIEYWGFKVDVDGLRTFSGELEEKISALEDEIYTLAEERFNINSPKQLGGILFDKLGLPVIKKTKTGYSTDAEVLDELSHKHEIVAKILEYRQLMKLKSTYVEGLLHVIDPETGKVHTSFKQTVTVTGRLSSTEPNLQNIPIKLEMGRKIRKVFVPSSEEYLLLDADYSQIELRVLAHITGDENMIEAFRNEEDIHTRTAAQIFGVETSAVTPFMRTSAKAVNFGIVYGIGDFSLAKDLGITKKAARKYIDDYLDNYPKVRQYMHDIVEQGKTIGYVTTLFHRRRYLPELQSSNFNIRSFGERIAMNTPIQGSAADIIKIAMVNVHRELTRRQLRSRLILQVHDELLVETHREEKTLVEQILKEGMEKAVALQVPLRADVNSGDTWYDAK